MLLLILYKKNTVNFNNFEPFYTSCAHTRKSFFSKNFVWPKHYHRKYKYSKLEIERLQVMEYILYRDGVE